MATYTGDLQIVQDEGGNYDISFPEENAQPLMTNGLETYVQLAVYGEDCWQNAIAQNDSEKMISEFPKVIKRNLVTDKTKNDGIKALEKALAPAVKIKIARKISVIGEIKTANRIDWQIDIERIDNEKERYYINWEKCELNPNLIKVA